MHQNDSTANQKDAIFSNQTYIAMPSEVIHDREDFMIVYTSIIFVGTCIYVFRSFAFFRMCLRISINMHDSLFRGITGARMIFFNNNPSGRILNRFSKDIGNVDALLPAVMLDVIDVSPFYARFCNFWHIQILFFPFFLVLFKFACYFGHCGCSKLSFTHTNTHNVDHILFNSKNLCKHRQKY